MLVYPSFIYLQNHKTGCSFVEACLRNFCNETLLGYKKHATLTTKPKQFCFTNVRNPMGFYRSLFAYGLDGKGTVYLRLKKNGFEHLYQHGKEGFSTWLDLVTQPKYSVLLDNHYTPNVASMIGFASWRFLRLACPGFESAGINFTNPDSLVSYMKENYILGAVLRQEFLREELSHLFSTRLYDYVNDHSSLSSWLLQVPNINASSISLENCILPENLLARVKSKDSLLYQHFYPADLVSSVSI